MAVAAMRRSGSCRHEASGRISAVNVSWAGASIRDEGEAAELFQHPEHVAGSRGPPAPAGVAGLDPGVRPHQPARGNWRPHSSPMPSVGVQLFRLSRPAVSVAAVLPATVLQDADVVGVEEVRHSSNSGSGIGVARPPVPGGALPASLAPCTADKPTGPRTQGPAPRGSGAGQPLPPVLPTSGTPAPRSSRRSSR